MSKTKRSICLYASEIAIITGDNKYQDVDELRDKIVQRINPDENVEEVSLIQEIMINHKDTPECTTADLTKILSACSTTTSTDKCNEILASIPKASKTKKIEQYINCEYGNATEAKAIKKYPKKIETKRANKFVKALIGTTPTGRKVFIGGRMDGQLQDGKVIEVKNRRYKLFHNVRDYEKLQIHAYMFINNAFGGATLIEQFNDDMDVHDVPYDSEWFRSKIDLLMSFSESLEDRL